jgi:hypothetical protein
MQEQQDESRRVGRRRLLRRAGTVAAGAAGATVAGGLVASPAQAAVDDPILVGGTHTGGASTTTLSSDSVTKPTLRLENSIGPALSIAPSASASSLEAPTGSVYLDSYGDFNVVGDEGGEKFLNPTYSPSWASMTVPVPTPIRWMDTRITSGRQHLRPGSTFDSSGRLMPTNSDTTPDAILDLSPLFEGGYGAVQVNLTVTRALNIGWVALWSDGNFPGHSNINYSSVTHALANFAQTRIGDDRAIRIKTNRPVAIIIDILGFVVADRFTQIPDVHDWVAGAGTRARGNGKRLPHNL